MSQCMRPTPQSLEDGLLADVIIGCQASVRLTHPRGLEGESAFTRQQSRHSGRKPSQTCNSRTYCLGVGQSHKPFSKVSPDLPQDGAKVTHVSCDPSRFLLPHLHEFSLLTHPRSGDGVCYQGNRRRISLGSPLPRSLFLLQFSSAQFSVQLFVTPWTAACQASVSITNSQSLHQTHVHQVGDAIQPSHPLLSPSSPTFNLAQHRGLFQ